MVGKFKEFNARQRAGQNPAEFRVGHLQHNFQITPAENIMAVQMIHKIVVGLLPGCIDIKEFGKSPLLIGQGKHFRQGI